MFYFMFCLFRANNEIGHCIIEEKSTGYGFADPYYIHPTLTDLVLHYAEVSLAEHNDKLNVKLTYPVEQPTNSGYTQMHEP